MDGGVEYDSSADDGSYDEVGSQTDVEDVTDNKELELKMCRWLTQYDDIFLVTLNPLCILIKVMTRYLSYIVWDKRTCISMTRREFSRPIMMI